MSKITVQARGKTFGPVDVENPQTFAEELLVLYHQIGELHSWSMYEGEDPYKDHNEAVTMAQGIVLDRLEKAVDK